MQHLDEGTLQAWLDGARSGLDPSKLDKIERHLATCDACASRVDALERSSFRAHALLSLGRARYAPRVSWEDMAKRAKLASTLNRPRRSKRTIAATWAASIVGATAMGWISNDLYAGSALDDGAAAVEMAEFAPVLAESPDVILADQRFAAMQSRTPSGGASSDADAVLVRGVVADEGGRPVASARVFVAEAGVSALTQPNGRYDLRLPRDLGSIELTVERIGFRQQARQINPGEADYVDADFHLREEALALDEIVVSGEGATERRPADMVNNTRARSFVWQPQSSIAAAGYVGSELWRLPGRNLMTLEIAYGDNPNETHVARVRQDLGNGVTLTLIQGRTDGRRVRWPIQSAGAVLSTWRGEMLITATAPVSTDSLRVLLSQLR